MAANSDIAAAVNVGLLQSGYIHWLRFGQAEGSQGIVQQAHIDLSLFDEAFYLSQNTDVAAAVRAGTYSSGLWI